MENSFRRLLSVLTYFCMVYGILLGMLMTFGVKTRSLPVRNINTAQNTIKFTDDATKSLESNGIYVSSLKPYDVVSSPLTLSGWVVKNTFPNEKFSAIIVDDSGEILAVSEVNAKEVGNIVNFATNIEFGMATNETGNIFFEDSHESSEGTTEIVSYRMPVKFAQIQAPTVTDEEASLETFAEEPAVAGYETQYWGQQEE